MIIVRAAVLSASRSTEPYSESRPIRTELLRLAAPGPGEVLIKVRAVGLCHSDLSVVNGSRPRPLPMVLGHEGAGMVSEVGAGVHDFAAGDHVVFSFVPACGRCILCLSGRPALCTVAAQANGAGTLLSGCRRFSRSDGEPVNHQLGVSALSDYTVVAANSLVKIDPSLDLESAALFGCALLTGVGAVVNTAEVPAGASVAVFGLGGVGMASVMGAHLVGANPIIAIDPFEAKLDQARKLGATHTLEPGPETTEEIAEITGGGADFTFEAVGSAAVLASAYAATGRGGMTVAIGLPHPNARLEISAVSIVAEERRIQGSYMGSAVPRRDVPKLIGLHLAGRLPLDGLVSATLNPDQINEGFDALAGGHVVRQIVRFPA